MDITDYAVNGFRGKIENPEYYFGGYDCVYTPVAYTYVYFEQNRLLLEPKFYTEDTIEFWQNNGVSVNTSPELTIAKQAINSLPQLYFVESHETNNGQDDYYFIINKFIPIQLEYAGYFYRDAIDTRNGNNKHQYYREIYYKVIVDESNKAYLKATNQSGVFSTELRQISGDYFTLVTEYGISYIEKYIHSPELTTTGYYTGNYNAVRGKINTSITDRFTPYISQYARGSYSDNILQQYPLKVWGTCTFNTVPYNTKWLYNLLYSSADSRKPIIKGANKYYFGGYRYDVSRGQSPNLYMPGVSYRLINFAKPSVNVNDNIPAIKTIDYQFTANSLNDGDIVLIPGDDTALIINPDDYLYMSQNVRYNNENPTVTTCRQVFTTTNAEHAKVNGRIYTANAKKSLINPYDENAKTGGGCGSYGD